MASLFVGGDESLSFSPCGLIEGFLLSAEYCQVHSEVLLHRSNVSDTCMHMLGVVPVEERGKPATCMACTRKWLWVADVSFGCSEEGLDEWIVIADPRMRECELHLHLGEKGNKGDPSHRTAVVGVNELWFDFAISYDPFDQLFGNLGAFGFFDRPADNHAREDVDDHVGVQKPALHISL